MKTISLLRYPGGKACLAPALASLIEANQLTRPVIAEPYAGGAGASLELLFAECAESILINDLDYRIFSMWWAALRRTDEFLKNINSVPLTISEWKRQRNIYRDFRKHKRFEVGFATFYLNRTNRSGILVNGGPIGGIEQTGKWRIDARFSRSTLRARVERIAAYGERIKITNLDALEFIARLDDTLGHKPVFLYLDPPYFKKGADLYLSNYLPKDHAHIAITMDNSKHRHWAITYDDVRPIRRMYVNCNVLPFRLRYSAQRRRRGAELLIVPKSLAVPAGLLRSLRK